MKGTAKSTAGAFVLAGAALAATAAWCAPAEDAAGSVMEHAVGNTTESAMPSTAGNATENATGNATGNATNDAAEDAARNAAGSATENDAGSKMEMPVEQAPETAPANANGKATDEATESAIDNATGNAAEGATESATEGAGMHMHHAVAPGTTHSMVDYALPPVELVRDDGKTVSLVDELNDGRPVILTFIYTSCTTICPMISQTLERLQGELGSDRDKVHIVSISIDPEEDTPARLRAYAARFEAGPEWQHYTGSVDASIAAQRAFNVYRGDKMNHAPVAFLRAAPGKQWMRIDGFATPSELLAAYRDVVASD
nr:SCO family protein [Burkholderia ubonensis]